MDPITGAIAIAGLGMQLFGAGGAMSATSKEAGLASQESGLSQGITQLQMQENNQRQLAMQISARRQQTEIMRRTQLTKAQGLAAGVNQGAQFGTGVQGGQQSATSAGGYNLLGVNQNLEIGNALFGIQNQISNKQIAMSGIQGQMASLQGQASMFSGIGAIGGSLASSAGPLGNLLGNFFGNKQDPTANTQGGMGMYSGAQTGSLY